MAYRTFDQNKQEYYRDNYGASEGYGVDRSGLSVHRPSANYFPPMETHQKRNSMPVSNQKKAELKNKIKEIIQLCKEENAGVTYGIAGVAEAEKGIYNLLEQANFGASEPTHPKNNANYVPPTPVNHTLQSANYTPIRGNPQEGGNPGRQLQQGIRSVLSQNPNVTLSEEAMHLINEIERRCLTEIEKMRDEKLALIAQLNEEIKQHNATKRRAAETEKQLEFYKKNQGAGAAGVPAGRYEQQLKERIAYLEATLHQTQSKGALMSEHPDFKILFAQGEAIRQQTLRLLRLKEAKGFKDDEEKREMRAQIEALTRKVEFYENERGGRASKPSYEEEYSPIAPSHKRKDSYRNSANEYESLVMEMRKITNN